MLIYNYKYTKYINSLFADFTRIRHICMQIACTLSDLHAKYNPLCLSSLKITFRY